jgi:hypothetical protein
MGLLLLMGGVSDPNPQSLFAQNEQGLAIDIGDRNGASQAKIVSGLTGETFKAAYPNHSLYQDANGVTPAIQPGDPVGLVIDSSRGGLENLGAELVTNGGFDSDTWWTKSTNVTISGGLANYNTVALNNGVFRSGVVTAGKFYVVTFTVASFSSGGVRVYTGGNRTSTYAATGTYRVFCLAGSSDTQIIFEATSAGTVLALDNISVREIPGIHPYQTNGSQRPALCRTPDGGRRNLLTYSEQFDVTSGGWTKTNSTISANATTAPDGTSTADTLIDDATNADHKARQSIAITSGTTYTVSVYAKANTLNFVWIYAGTPNVGRVFNLATGATGGTVGNAPTSSAISAIGNGWYRCSITYTAGATSTQNHDIGTSPDGTSINYIGTGQSAYLWGAQLETGSSATTYQKVTTTHDVTESGKRDCWGLLADGSDDSLITSSVDFNTWTAQTRRNLLVDTESFGASTWTKTAGGTGSAPVVTENQVANPVNGEITADLVVFDIGAGTSSADISQLWQSPTLSSAQYTYSFYAKTSDGSTKDMAMTNAADNLQIITITPSWQRFTFTGTGTTGPKLRLRGSEATTKSASIHLYGWQLEASTLTDYQRVGTDKMTVMAGVRKNTDATGQIVELSANSFSNNGSFGINTSTLPLWGFSSMGTVSAGANTVNGSSVAPKTSVLTLRCDIAGDVLAVRENSADAASSSGNQGSGNFGNYALFIGSRAGTSFRFNGILYTLIVRGAATPTGTIADFEKNLLRIRAGLGPF